MSYLIRTTDGTLVTQVEEQSVDTTATPLALVGRAYFNYGEKHNTNFIKLMENFASTSEPTPAFTGMLWYDKGHDLLNVRQFGTWNAMATQVWATGQFVAQTDFSNGSYATQAYVQANFESLADFASRNLASEAWVLGQDYIAANQPIAIAGDMTGVGNTYIAVTLADNGVVTGTYQKVVVDTKGRVSSGGLLTQQDVITALGYTPENATGQAGQNIFTFTYGALDSTAGSVLSMLELDSTNTNANRLLFSTQRNVAGSDWTSASTRMQLVTDATRQGFIEFNAPGHQGGFAIGANDTRLIHSFANSGSASTLGLGIDGTVALQSSLSIGAAGNTRLFFTDANFSAHAIVFWDATAGSLKLAANGNGANPVIVRQDGSAQAANFLFNDLGGLYNPGSGVLQLRVNGQARHQIDTNGQSLWSGGASSLNGNGGHQLDFRDGLLVKYNLAGSSVVNTFSVDQNGGLYAAGNISGDSLTTRRGQLFLNSLPGTDANYVYYGDQNGNTQGLHWWDGSNFHWSAQTGSWGNQMTLDPSGSLYLHGSGSLVAPRFFMRDPGGNGDTPDTGMQQGYDNELELTSSGHLRFQIVPDGSAYLYFGPNNAGPNYHAGNIPFYEMAWQTDRNVVLYVPQYDGNGNAIINGDGSQAMTGAWASNTSTSDARLKENVADLTDGLDVVNRLRPVTYAWKQDSGLHDGGVVHTGFLAQDVAAIVPDAVDTLTHARAGTETMILHKQELVPHLVRAVQQLSTENDLLKHRLDQMERQIAALLRR